MLMSWFAFARLYLLRPTYLCIVAVLCSCNYFSYCVSFVELVCLFSDVGGDFAVKATCVVGC